MQIVNRFTRLIFFVFIVISPYKGLFTLGRQQTEENLTPHTQILR